jgi:hypothetical protein
MKLGRNEADEEIQVFKESRAQFSLHFSGAINFDPVVTVVDAKMASQIVWLDAYITNVDRTLEIQYAMA